MDPRRNPSFISTISGASTKTHVDNQPISQPQRNAINLESAIKLKEEESKEETAPKQTFLEALLGFLKGISIEPMLFVKYMADRMYLYVQHNFKLERFCSQYLNYTEEECALMDDGNHTEMQVEAQQMDNAFGIYETLAYTIVPLFLVLFAGSWSDRNGRKIPICSSILGYVLYMAVYYLVAYFTTWPLELLLVGEFLKGVGGGTMMYLMAVYSFLADRTTTGDRLYRMAIMNAIWHLGSPLGVVLGAWILDIGGYLWVFGAAFTLYILCILYVWLVVEDKKHKSVSSGKHGCTNALNPRHVVDTLRFVFRNHPGRGRTHLLVLIATILLYICALPHNRYLWARRLFGWDLNKFSLWESIDTTFHQGLMLCVSPLIPLLGIHDLILGAMAVFLLLVAALWEGCVTQADQWWVIYATTLINLFPQFPAVTIRSTISKIFNKDAGKAFSLLAILEVLWVLADKSIYVKVYDATVETYPSAQSFVEAVFALTVILLLIGIRISMAQVEKKLKKDMGRDRAVTEKEEVKY